MVISTCLKDIEQSIREAAASTIGKLGLPEGISSIDNLIKSTLDPENNIDVKVKSLWAIGRLSDACDKEVGLLNY